MPTFKVQGQIYHNIGPLTPAAEQRPEFVQVYFIDDRGQQADARLSWQIDRESQLNRHTTLCLQDMLHEHNEHVRIFKTALEQRTPDMPDYRVVIRADRVPRRQHQRTFNAPSGNDVAALLPEGQEGYRDIVLSNRDSRIKRITEIHRSYDSLQYSLLFPRGEDGYTILCRQKDPKTNQITEKKMSMLQFYAFKTFRLSFDPILRVSAYCTLCTADILRKFFGILTVIRFSIIQFIQVYTDYTAKARFRTFSTSTDFETRAGRLSRRQRRYFTPTGHTVICSQHFAGGVRILKAAITTDN